jgi:hypothetical protein
MGRAQLIVGRVIPGLVVVGSIKKAGWRAWRGGAFNPNTWEAEAEAGRFLSSRPAWSTEWVPGQPRLHRETLSQKTNKQTNKQKNKQTKKERKKGWVSRPISSPPPWLVDQRLPPGFCPVWVPSLASLISGLGVEVLARWTFLSSLTCSWSWCFITAVVTLTEVATHPQLPQVWWSRGPEECPCPCMMAVSGGRLLLVLSDSKDMAQLPSFNPRPK